MNMEDLPMDDLQQQVPEASAVAGNFGPDGFDRNGEFQGQEALVKFMVAESIPQLFQDCKYFQKFIDLVNPAQPKVSSVALRKTAFKLMARYREDSLLPILRSFKGRVSLASSVWFDHDGYEKLKGLVYLYLNCHWIDEQWEKQSRVLGFLQLDRPIEDNPRNVSSLIRRIVSRWEIGEKILSINFDGTTNVPASVSQLKQSLNPMLDGELLHSKCAYHIVNWCLEDGFSAITDLVDKVRDVVNFFYTDESKGQQLRQRCISSGMKFRRLYFDISDWNNTVYDMVDGFIRIRDILVEFCKLEPDVSNCHGVPLPLLTEDEWTVLCSMRNFFEKFRAAFDILCSVYIPTTNLVIPILVTLSDAFAKYRDNNDLGRICSAMEAKFSAYWDDDIPMLYCLATILDPRYKLDGLFKLLDSYNGNMKIQIRDRKPEIKNLLYRMYDAYSKQYVPVVPEGLVRTGLSTGTKTALSMAHSLRDDSEVKVTSYSEIEYYLSSDDLSWSFGMEDTERLEMLDVLKWWKHYEGRYPVLGSMARDLLAMAMCLIFIRRRLTLGGGRWGQALRTCVFASRIGLELRIGSSICLLTRRESHVAVMTQRNDYCSNHDERGDGDGDNDGNGNGEDNDEDGDDDGEEDGDYDDDGGDEDDDNEVNS